MSISTRNGIEPKVFFSMYTASLFIVKRSTLRIPRKLDTRSAANWTLVPAQTGQLFHAKLDTWGVTARGRGCGFTPDGSGLSNRPVFSHRISFQVELMSVVDQPV